MISQGSVDRNPKENSEEREGRGKKE